MTETNSLSNLGESSEDISHIPGSRSQGNPDFCCAFGGESVSEQTTEAYRLEREAIAFPLCVVLMT